MEDPCEYCTFVNEANRDICEVCEQPLSKKRKTDKREREEREREERERADKNRMIDAFFIANQHNNVKEVLTEWMRTDPVNLVYSALKKQKSIDDTLSFLLYEDIFELFKRYFTERLTEQSKCEIVIRDQDEEIIRRGDLLKLYINALLLLGNEQSNYLAHVLIHLTKIYDTIRGIEYHNLMFLIDALLIGLSFDERMTTVLYGFEQDPNTKLPIATKFPCSLQTIKNIQPLHQVQQDHELQNTYIFVGNILTSCRDLHGGFPEEPLLVMEPIDVIIDLGTRELHHCFKINTSNYANDCLIHTILTHLSPIYRKTPTFLKDKFASVMRRKILIENLDPQDPNKTNEEMRTSLNSTNLLETEQLFALQDLFMVNIITVSKHQDVGKPMVQTTKYIRGGDGINVPTIMILNEAQHYSALYLPSSMSDNGFTIRSDIFEKSYQSLIQCEYNVNQQIIFEGEEYTIKKRLQLNHSKDHYCDTVIAQKNGTDINKYIDLVKLRSIRDAASEQELVDSEVDDPEEFEKAIALSLKSLNGGYIHKYFHHCY